MIRKVAFSVLLLMSFAFGYLYYVQYFMWRGCFNELGRCYDNESGVVYLEQSGGVWLTLAILTFGTALYLASRLIRQKD